MKQFFSICVIVICVITVTLQGAETFKRIEQWRHNQVCGYEFFSLVDKDNHVIGGFYKTANLVISSDKIFKFAPYGQGPSDLTDALAAFFYKGDLAIVEMPDKVKIFTKKNGTYVWKETKWLKRGIYVHSINSGMFFDNKWFLAGEEQLDYKKKELHVSYLKVLDEKGQLLKRLIKRKMSEPKSSYLMRYYIVGYKNNRVFFLQENKLNVTAISSRTLEVVREVNLEIPPFYKSMPKEFYAFKKYENPGNLLIDLENWALGYSRITKVVMEGNHLVIQIRTCSDKLKKFALLFYNAENNFKLEKTIFVDDFLLGVKDGKYYCFANGNPGRDEDTDECIINIYAFAGEKQK